MIGRMKAEGYTRFDVKLEEEEKYLEMMWKASPVSNGKPPPCTPGYYNDEGKVRPAGEKVLGGLYPGGARAFFELLERERKAGKALDCFHLA